MSKEPPDLKTAFLLARDKCLAYNFASKPSLQRAKKSLEEAKERLEKALETLGGLKSRSELKAAIKDINAANRFLNAADPAFKSAEEFLDLTEEAFELGRELVSVLDKKGGDADLVSSISNLFNHFDSQLEVFCCNNNLFERFKELAFKLDTLKFKALERHYELSQ